MKNEELFDSLVQNAFEFLDRTLAELDSAPKHALINFVTAVELLFKARLSLVGAMWVAEEPTAATPERFAKGSLRTVGLELARQRIEALSEDRVDDVRFKIFQGLARHRNRVIHFFHPNLSKQHERDAIAGEICVGWFHLYGLLTGLWATEFGSYSKRTREFGVQLQTTTRFLGAVFAHVLKTNANAKTFSKCPSCGYAALDNAMGERYTAALCRVCGYREPSHKAIQHGEEDFSACCAWCDGQNTVVETAFGFKCTACGESFSECKTCEYCSEHWVGTSDSDFGDYYSGCPLCGGAASNIKDD